MVEQQNFFGQLKKRVEELVVGFPILIERFKKEMIKLIPNFEEKVNYITEQIKYAELNKPQYNLNSSMKTLKDIRTYLCSIEDEYKRMNLYLISL